MERDFWRFDYLFIKRLFGVLSILSVSFYFTWIALGGLEYTSTDLLQEESWSMDTGIRYKMKFSTSRNTIKPVSIKNVTRSGETIYYEKCMHIPDPPKGMEWYEERFIHDPPLTDMSNIVSLSNSRVRIIGREVVGLGAKIRVLISLYDENKVKRKGGDLVRVWMREQSIKAAAAAKVTDKRNGDYEAELTALWVGRPQIRVAVIAPREVLAIKFRRRYICPPIHTNMGVFGHTSGRTEKTPCSYYPQIPGFIDMCDLTEENYGQPWYCGKPRFKDIPCNEWTFISKRFLGDTYDKELYTTLENKILTRGYNTMLIPMNVTVEIMSDSEQQTVSTSDIKCNKLDKRLTWNQTAPSSYVYKNRWITPTCSGRGRHQRLTDCAENTKIIFIGDSTVRQFFLSLSVMIPCKWKTKPKNPHTTYYCENTALKYSIEYLSHGLPFCTGNTYHSYFRSIKANLNLIRRSRTSPGTKVIVLIHMFSHFLNYHSHVLYENMIGLNIAVVEFLKAVPHAHVIIKGPHSYMERFLHLPTCYMETYIEYLNQIFKEISDKVMFLDAAEITIATEDKALHPKENTIREMIFKMFDFVCSY